MRVVVIRLAMPKPCGIMSAQKWKVEEFSFQQAMEMLAKIVINDEAKVRL